MQQELDSCAARRRRDLTALITLRDAHAALVAEAPRAERRAFRRGLRHGATLGVGAGAGAVVGAQFGPVGAAVGAVLGASGGYGVIRLFRRRPAR